MYSSSFPDYSMFTRPHRVSRLTFLIYSLDLLYKFTYIFWALTCIVALPSCIALISSFCTSSHDFYTHFLHFHLTMDSLCFSNWLAIYTSNTDFHRLAKRHACRTIKKQASHACFFFLITFFVIRSFNLLWRFRVTFANSSLSYYIFYKIATQNHKNFQKSFDNI